MQGQIQILLMKYGDLSLHAAVYGTCSTEVLQKIVDHGADVNAVNNTGDTAILLAACTAQRAIVRLLLIAGAGPNIANTDGDACLHGAVDVDCSEEILQDLIVYDADVNAVNKSGRTPLLLSCFYGQMDSVKVLLGAGADPTISDEEDFSCLHAAVDGRCSKDTLQALIGHGAHIDAKRKDGTTALLSACRTGQSTSVMFLLDSGADVKLRKPDGNTCLYLAVNGHCSKETLQKIIDQGSNVNALNRNGETALIRACYNAQTESVKVLLENGADPNISDASGHSGILAAVHGQCTNEILKEIIACKVDLDAQNKDGRTALVLACFYRQQEAVQVLLEAGSNPNITDNNGHGSLYAAVFKGCRQKIIQAMIDHHADVNATSKDKVTAIMCACNKRRVYAIHVLLKARADINIADTNGDTCLKHAVYGDCSEEVLQAIIDRGADVNVTDKRNDTALMCACRKRCMNAIKVLLKAGADPTIADNTGNTCLMYAVHADCSDEVLQAIIDHGVDVNATSKDNHTALLIACQKRHEDAIYVLLNAGFDTNNAYTDGGNTCLMAAVISHCSKEVLQAIIDHGADVNATDKNNCTALMWAIKKRHADAIHVLLKAGADTKFANKNGQTCLMYAVYSNCSEEVLQAIIDHGADVNATNKDNYTALLEACRARHVDAIHVLVKAGADTNIADKDGHTCLTYIVLGDYSNEVLQALIDHGANLNATCKHDNTALMKACKKRNEDAIRVLLKAGADTNIVDQGGQTVLMYAVYEKCSKQVLQAIIDHDADVNATDKDNCTALVFACDKRHVDAIHVLLQAGADPNTSDDKACTCLMHVVLSDYSEEVLKVIIDHGADVNATDKDNHTALMFTCIMGHAYSIHVLLKAGADVNIAEKDGHTSLMCAVRSDCSKEVLQAIIDHGAIVNAVCKHNETALMRACYERREAAIHVLLKTGADTNIVKENGETCLRCAVHGNCSKEVLQAIIDHGVDVNATNENNGTALMTACEIRHVDAIHVLLKAGAKTNIADTYGQACLMYAVGNDYSNEVLQAIIEQDADVNSTDKWSITPLNFPRK